jgi:phosphoribosylformimino-5-aminoimidazole carboxamide ribotide isomerase
MRILPVIDLMRGQVVRGVAGRRETYQPIVSQLAPDARSMSIGRALVEHGATDCYVADLDAIAGSEPSWSTYRELINVGLRLWVDAGCGNRAAADALASFEHAGRKLQRIIVGLESLESVDELEAMRQHVGAECLVFSLDLRHGEPMTQPFAWPELSAEAIAHRAMEAGVAGMIVLDLAAVGGYGGPATIGLCERLRAAWPKLEIISGGGVRNADDLRKFAAAGCDYTLVASALHDGRIPVNYPAPFPQRAT